jgi:hypothetical protein
MNPRDNDPDVALRRTLQEWKVADSVPPRFGERVWHRIALEQSTDPVGLLRAFLRRFGEVMVRPTAAAIYLAVLLLSGIAVGYRQAHITNLHTSEELGSRYVRMMDPYQMPHP